MCTVGLSIERTKKGYPAFWESGGGWSNTGEATIIASPSGDPKRAIYVRRRGELANSEHALIPVAVGDYIIEAYHHRGDFQIKIYRVLNFKREKDEIYAVVEKVNCFSRNEWDAEFPAFLEAAVQASMEKATCYHCREPHFIKND